MENEYYRLRRGLRMRRWLSGVEARGQGLGRHGLSANGAAIDFMN
jgi:hypothetical protein